MKARRESYTCKRKGNQQQLDHAVQVLDKFDEASDALRAESYDKVKAALDSGTEVVSKRIKVIKMADKSEFGWSTVNEYLSDELASDSDDEKRMFRAERRAERKTKKRRRRFRPVDRKESASPTPTPSYSRSGPPYSASDVLSSGIWLEAASLSDSSLSEMVPGLIDLQLDAKAPSTVLKYKSGWLRWRRWALSKLGVLVVPTKPLHIALFISELAKRSSENSFGVSPVESAIYANKWGHAMAGIEACPVSHPLVKFALEGAKKRLARPVQPKEPLSVSTVQAIAAHFASTTSLSDLRFLFILLVGFAGFFRIAVKRPCERTSQKRKLIRKQTCRRMSRQGLQRH
ncbi:hypothetical protein AWC38_SpisGene3542 [Stylophora pistillata]|uniref:Uncharacterized protein n=1 Tax=Stylophora pistillata TaxID=50429 RepID=A0A2B4SRD5_STYPI|nr:hypothetical protein AWC38_SpisGene3542 [Stylophora pistillata]